MYVNKITFYGDLHLSNYQKKTFILLHFGVERRTSKNINYRCANYKFKDKNN